MKRWFDVRHLFAPLQNELIGLLHELTREDWQKPTIAGSWVVKDVVTHLLDGDLRTLSIQRDRFFAETPPSSGEYRDMVKWLNQLNADWVKATKRLSPQALILLHSTTGSQVTSYYESLDPMAEAIFPVQWAGESRSLNWMHLAREYSEKWHHQQQIREAVGKEGILNDQFYIPLMRTFLQGIPNQLKSIDSNTGDEIQIAIHGQVLSRWSFKYDGEKWIESSSEPNQVVCNVSLPAREAWKLFSKSLRAHEIQEEIIIKGNKDLADDILNMVSVMA